MPDYREHILLSLLWEYSQTGELDACHLDHLRFCEDCVAIALLGKTSESVEHFRSSLTKYGIEDDRQ
jgi:hypothetical protein